MSLISKHLFYQNIGTDLSCKHLHYWNESCMQANLYIAKEAFWGSMKFYLPIYIIKALLNHNKCKDKAYLKKLLIEEARSAFYGSSLAILFLGGNCILYKVTGQLHYYNLGLVSGLISGLGLLIETKENHLLDTLIFFTVLVEAVFKNLNEFDIFKLNNRRETLLFMGVSSVLMHLLQNRDKNENYTNFWFYTPHTFKTKEVENSPEISVQKCDHSSSCSDFALKGAQKYFLLGYAFSIVKKLIPKMLTVYRKPSTLFKIMANEDNLRFGVFLGAYVGIYRYIICYLLNNKGFKQKYFGAIAGLVAGTTYSISPNFQILTVGITTILQMFYNRTLKTLEIENKFLPQQLVYMLAHSLLFHNAIMCQNTCPTYYVNMINTASNGWYKRIFENFLLENIFPDQLKK
ncbi:unnamed protein product [Ceutorhynchus assimilis]|uniref:Transmembrane protein 135 N-terminal domain-containing protein n=1 Tax=Ceutorhynchus assimilis TaxID=467358 RepID=A0A9N9QIQ1_9CUCU|nr:unnamed protein product [Ceutorhynchus assimilis]